MPEQIQVIATVNIALTPEGGVLVKAQGPELMVRGMLSRALEQLSAEWAKQQQGPKIVVAPPGMVIPHN